MINKFYKNTPIIISIIEFTKIIIFFVQDFLISLKKGSQYIWSISYIVFGLLVPILTVYFTAIQIIFLEPHAFVMEPIAQAAYSLTLAMSCIACILNSSFGALLGWVMARFNFFGPVRKLADCFIDLPFSVSTAVSGAALATTYATNGIFGHLLNQFGITVLFTKLGIAIAMLFASFPYMTRTIQATLYEIEPEIEEASASLGATDGETFRKVIFPILVPSLIAGALFIISRSIGEFGTIVMISSNVAYADLVATVLLSQYLENFDYTAATVVGTSILSLSFTLFISINILQNWSQKLLNQNFKFTFD